jgi:hypothetical protein
MASVQCLVWREQRVLFSVFPYCKLLFAPLLRATRRSRSIFSYGPAPKNEDTAINILVDVVKDQTGKEYKMDHYATRYPTNVIDIGEFLVKISGRSRSLQLPCPPPQLLYSGSFFLSATNNERLFHNRHLEADSASVALFRGRTIHKVRDLPHLRSHSWRPARAHNCRRVGAQGWDHQTKGAGALRISKSRLIEYSPGVHVSS